MPARKSSRELSIDLGPLRRYRDYRLPFTSGVGASAMVAGLMPTCWLLVLFLACAEPGRHLCLLELALPKRDDHAARREGAKA